MTIWSVPSVFGVFAIDALAFFSPSEDEESWPEIASSVQRRMQQREPMCIFTADMKCTLCCVVIQTGLAFIIS